MIKLNDWSLVLKNVFAFFAACGLTMSAHAGCYSVYNSAGKLIHQSSDSPVDTRLEYHRTVPQRFGQGSTLVYVNDQQPCSGVVMRVGAPGSGPGQAGLRPGRADRG